MDPIETFDDHNDSRKQLVLNLFELFVRNKWTLTCLEETAKLVNSVPGATINVPTTKHLLVKELMNFSKVIAWCHYRCTSCKEYTKSKYDDRSKISKCVECGETLSKSDFFVSFDLKQQIASVIEENFDIIEEFCNSKENRTNITDVHDSNHIKNIKYRNENIYSLTLNTDGVELINSNTSSLWPVLVTCNFLPPHIRFKDKHIFVAALHFGPKKPNMHELLRPLAEEMNDLSKGLFVRERFFNLCVTIAILDLPAKSDVSKLMLYNSRNACNFCLQRGQSTTKGIRYTCAGSNAVIRTHKQMIKDIIKVNNNPNLIINGIKGMSPMIAFQNFDLATGFPIDYMHAVLIGVTKKIISLWTTSENHKKPYYINKKRQRILNARLIKIKTPSYISRRPRSIEHLKKFKASELRSLLIYFIPLITERLLAKKYIEHFKLLSTSIYTLLQPSISNDELNMTEEKLKQFVHEFQEYYGMFHMTMNVHSLLHLVYCVRNYGPLWAFSMFPFESFNGTLKSYVVAPTDVLHQITIRHLCYKATKAEDKSESNGSIALKNEEKVLLEPAHIDAINTADLVSTDNFGLKYYSRYQNSSTVFTSRLYSKARYTANFFIETVNGDIGAVELYISCNGQYYAIIEILQIINRIDQFIKFRFSNTYAVIRAVDIIERFIHIEVMKDNFLVRRPNSYERN